MSNNLLFQRLLGEWNIELTQKQREQFDLYYKLLVEWNGVVNLTSITDYEEVVVKHFIDSLSLIKVVDCNASLELIDVGTGAGFPGIPLKIAFPNLKVTLLDSLNKRIKFLDHVIDKCELEETFATHGRAEDYGNEIDYRETYDVCVSRAVANLSTLSEYCLPFVKVGGVFIPYKSGKSVEEMEKYGNAIAVLGGSIQEVIHFELPDSDIERSLLVIEKKDITPAKYPRNAGKPAKKPLL